ncbi:MAG: ERCC4 domain-containing protein [Candidatus Heimdallarchaeota archaeon]
MNSRLRLIVDHREPLRIKKALSERFEMVVEERQLDIGDYVFSEQVACERKTGADLISSLMDNRLFEQIDRLIEAYEQPLLLLEDLPSAFARTEWKKRKKHVYGALTYIFLKRQVPVVPTVNMGESAICLNRIASWVQEEKTDPIIIRSSPKKRSIRDQQLFLIQGLHNTGIKKAETLLQTFDGSPSEVFKGIVDTQITYTKTGNPKGLEGPLASLEGFGPKYVLKNQELLQTSKKV